MSPKGQLSFQGFQRPNYTMVPDELFDELLPELSGAELKVLLYIVRRTFGFKKDSDNISLSQMMHGIRTRDGRVLDRGVGLTKKTVLGALRNLESSNIIMSRRRQSQERGNEPTEYRLNIINASTNGHTPLGGKIPHPLEENCPQGVEEKISPSPGGRNYAQQETDKQQTDRQSSNIRMVSVSSGFSSKSRSNSKVTSGAEPNDQEILASYMQSIALELRDGAPLRSTVTRLLRLYYRSDLTQVSEFIDVLYQAKAIAREHTGSIRAGEPGARRIMPYFIAIVEDLLGLKEQTTRSDDGRPD